MSDWPTLPYEEDDEEEDEFLDEQGGQGRPDDVKITNMEWWDSVLFAQILLLEGHTTALVPDRISHAIASYKTKIMAQCDLCHEAGEVQS